MTLVAYYFADQIDSAIDTFTCDDEQEGILLLIDAMKNLKNDSILTTARQYAENRQFDAALHCIDTWSEEYNVGGNTFTYTIKGE